MELLRKNFKVNGYLIELGADLAGADLSGADLRNTNLITANLQGANLTKANLTGAKLFKQICERQFWLMQT